MFLLVTSTHGNYVSESIHALETKLKGIQDDMPFTFYIINVEFNDILEHGLVYKGVINA